MKKIINFFNKNKNLNLKTGGFSLPAAVISDRGHVREVNQDAYLMQENAGVFLVADGMGGGAFGEKASALLAQPFEKLDVHMTFGDKTRLIKQALHQRHSAILGLSQQCGQTVGSTVVVCIIDGESHKMALLWCGDSRAYMLRKKRLSQLTEDHRYVTELLKSGLITAEELETHPYATRLTHVVGVEPQLHLDEKITPFKPGDRLLLCSDGIHGELNDQTLTALLDTRQPVQSIGHLFDQAIKKTAARDNYTAMLIDL